MASLTKRKHKRRGKHKSKKKEWTALPHEGVDEKEKETVQPEQPPFGVHVVRREDHQSTRVRRSFAYLMRLNDNVHLLPFRFVAEKCGYTNTKSAGGACEAHAVNCGLPALAGRARRTGELIDPLTEDELWQVYNTHQAILDAYPGDPMEVFDRVLSQKRGNSGNPTEKARQVVPDAISTAPVEDDAAEDEAAEDEAAEQRKRINEWNRINEALNDALVKEEDVAETRPTYRQQLLTKREEMKTGAIDGLFDFDEIAPEKPTSRVRPDDKLIEQIRYVRSLPPDTWYKVGDFTDVSDRDKSRRTYTARGAKTSYRTIETDPDKWRLFVMFESVDISSDT